MAKLEKVGTFRAWKVEASDVILGESSKKGTPYVEVHIGTEEGETRWQGYLSGGALEYTMKNLRAMGFEGDDLGDLSSVGSKEFEIVTAFEEYEGQSYLKVKFVNDLGGGGPGTAMDAEKRRKFAAAMKGKIRALGVSAPAANVAGAKKPATPRRQPSQPEPPPVDDDIPF